MSHDQRTGAGGQRSHAAQTRRGVLGSLLAAPLLLAVSSCAPDDFAQSSDPLLGPPVRAPNAQVAGPIAPGGSGIPPLPAAAPSNNPAALTSSGRGPLDPNRPELRIGGPDSTAPAWQGSGGGATGVALQPPQPLTGGGAVPLQPKVSVQPVSNATSATYEQLRAQLVQRGVSLISLTIDVETGDTKVMCQVPKNGTPNVHQTYQTQAKDEVSALQAVLDKIDHPAATQN